MFKFNIFGRKKHRRYPIRRDIKGLSLRARSFELFAEGQRPVEVAGKLKAKESTVLRYFRDWIQLGLTFKLKYAYAQELFKKTNPERDKNLESYAGICGIEKEEFENILSQPYGLRRLLMGKFHFPVQEEADRKRRIALELAVLISNYVINEKGQFTDVYFALKRWMKQNKHYRELNDAEIEKDNKAMALIHEVLAASTEAEKKGRVKRDTLSEKERDTIIKLAFERENKNMEIWYWIGIALHMAGGLTKEEAREKMYQDAVATGDMKTAKELREFQDKVHPLKSNDQVPPPSLPESPATT
jgi:hypothetical protein